MTCLAINIGSQYCVQCDAVPAVTGVPERILSNPNYGWNSSAYSKDALGGDCYTQFDVPATVIGTVNGFAIERISNDPRDVPHAFYIYENAGRKQYCVMESGIAKTSPVTLAGQVFRIERRAGVVRYFVNGTQIYRSLALQYERLRVVACMYSSSDGVN